LNYKGGEDWRVWEQDLSVTNSNGHAYFTQAYRSLVCHPEPSHITLSGEEMPAQPLYL